MTTKGDENMKKGMVAPIVITAILVGLLCCYLVVWTLVAIPIAVMFIGSVILLAFIGVSIYVLIERIKEIEGGEEDDLSKY